MENIIHEVMRGAVMLSSIFFVTFLYGDKKIKEDNKILNKYRFAVRLAYGEGGYSVAE